MTKLFTSEGASGRAITELSCEYAVQIGRALALLLQNRAAGKVKILIGRDTRISGEVLTASFAAGCCSAGADAHILGIVPTPAVSYLCEKYSADAGVMITASHNPFEFNGIRIFDSAGHSMSESLIGEIERLVTNALDEMQVSGGEHIGSIVYEKNAEWDYVRGLMKRIGADLGRMRIVIDCANGAACGTAEKFFRGIGANVIMINDSPDGKNINLGGTVDTEALKSSVLDSHAQAGIAFDGDAGRCLIIDEKGRLIDGDRITAILASAMKADQSLNANTCVVSQTANLGFFRWAKENGIVVSAVQDSGWRFIVERMLLGDYSLGGSPSGHIVLLGASKTADGQLAAARVLEIMKLSGKKMSELGSVYEPYPRVAMNLAIRPEYVGRWDKVPAVAEIVDYCQKKLEGDGRVFIRESSTSPIIRLIVEGREGDTVWQYAQAIAKAVRDNVGTEQD